MNNFVTDKKGHAFKNYRTKEYRYTNILFPLNDVIKKLNQSRNK